jgi:hypothetical protein
VASNVGFDLAAWATYFKYGETDYVEWRDNEGVAWLYDRANMKDEDWIRIFGSAT